MAHLIERTVQERAVSYLAKHYQSRSRSSSVFAELEVRTKKKYGGKRADGLLAFNHWLYGAAYVVSLEAKSFKTIPAIKPYRNNWKLIKNSIWFALFVVLGSGAFFAIYRMNDGYFQFVIPFNVFLISGLVFAYFSRNSYRHKKVKVLDQLAQYPANEKWLAFSDDIIKKIGEKQYDHLVTICKSEGIGLITVGKNEKVKIKFRPSWSWNRFRKYLHYYAVEKQVRREI